MQNHRSAVDIIRPESAILLCRSHTVQNIENRYRLIRSVDAEKNADIFSIFLSTSSEDGIDEEFLFDISRRETAARAFLELIAVQNVTASTLRDVAADILAEM